MLPRKRIITIVIASLAAVLLIAGGIWYYNNYVGKEDIAITSIGQLDYEWQKIASDDGIVGEYIWQRTTNLMIRGDEVMIPSWHMIPGRLSYQTNIVLKIRRHFSECMSKLQIEWKHRLLLIVYTNTSI